MARTDHGTNLSEGLVLQPGSTFTRSKSGADTGSRTFKCDASVAEALAPRRGESDTVSVSNGFANMFVDTVTIAFGKAEIATISVTYMGAMNETGSTGATENNITYDVSADFDAIDSANANPVGTVKFTKFSPRVSHSYAINEDPPNNVGDYVDPPMFADKIASTELIVPSGAAAGTWTLTFSQAGWRLQARNIKVVGQSREVTDSYMYSYYVSEMTVVQPGVGTTTFAFDPPV